jgi:hypothetical protein
MYKVLFSPFMKLNLTFYSLMYKIHSSQGKTFTMNCLYKTLKKWQGLSDAIRSQTTYICDFFLIFVI